MEPGIPYRFGNPEESGRQLVEVDPRTGKLFDEQWLQQRIAEHPDMLPLYEFDASYAQAASIGMEIPVRSGQIDNLLCSPSGGLVVIEAKLLRNPEASRSVVAQTLDYVRALVDMSFDDLNGRVQSRNGGAGIVEVVRRSIAGEALDGDLLRAAVTENLRNGKLLALIVGDRIHPGVVDLASMVGRHPQLQFTLGLVELRCYSASKDCSWPLTIVPRIVERTHEVVRHVVRVTYEGQAPQVEVAQPEEAERSGSPATAGGRAKINRETFLATVSPRFAEAYRNAFDDWESRDLDVRWGTAGVTLGDTVTGKRRNLLEAYPDALGISILLPETQQRLGIPDEAYKPYHAAIADGAMGQRALAQGRRMVSYQELDADELGRILRVTTDLVATLGVPGSNQI
jgi:hypothetical protein